MHVNTGVTACLEVSGQPWMSVLAFHLVGAEILVACNIGWASWLAGTAPGDSPVHVSHLALGVLGLQMHPG